MTDALPDATELLFCTLIDDEEPDVMEGDACFNDQGEFQRVNSGEHLAISRLYSALHHEETAHLSRVHSSSSSNSPRVN